ncbi:hypothetical protein [EBPR podovirus 1]|nr:hypothetical protein [EBPR podovirus 1]
MEQTKRFGPLHLRDRIFPDDCLGMKDEPLRLECPNQVPAKVFQADEPIALFAGREQHAVERHVSTGPHDALQFCNEKREVLEKLFIASAVAHIARAVAVGVEARKRRRENAVVDRLVWKAAQNVDAISVIEDKALSCRLINAVHATPKNDGKTICRDG